MAQRVWRAHDPRCPVGILSRRGLLQRAGLVGIAAVVGDALPLARELIGPQTADAQPVLSDATLQAFADTIIPGRRASRTESGRDIHAQAIAGVDDAPGAVEADALALYQSALFPYRPIAPAFLAELESRSLPQGGPFLVLPYDARVDVSVQGLSFDNPTRQIWELSALLAFFAFCTGALVTDQAKLVPSGFRVMGFPGAAPEGYWAGSYRRRLGRERTRSGSLP